MYQQDLELIKTLLARINDLDGLSRKMQDELQELRELHDALNPQSTKARFGKILSKATARLKGSKAEADDITAQGQLAEIAQLSTDLRSIQDEYSECHVLLHELREQAPELVELAEGKGAQPDLADGVLEQAGDQRTTQLGGGLGSSDETTSESILTEQIDLSELFKLEQIKTKEAFTWGRESTFVFDCQSILSNLPLYSSLEQAHSTEVMTNRVLRHLDALATQLSGEVVAVTAEPFELQIPPLQGLQLVCADATEEEEGRESVARTIQCLVNERDTGTRSVVVVTAEQDLGGLSGQRVFEVPLSTVFRMS